MMAALSLAGMQTRGAAATKNVLASVMNAAAVLLFVFSVAVRWKEAAVLGVSAIVGGLIGAKMLSHFPENVLRIVVVYSNRGRAHHRPVLAASLVERDRRTCPWFSHPSSPACADFRKLLLVAPGSFIET